MRPRILLSTFAALAIGVAQAQQAAPPPSLDDRVAALERELAELRASRESSPRGDQWYDHFHVGGYGELHVNAPERGGAQIDASRFVLNLGYRFDDRVSLYSETELQHALVEDGNGELELEQLYLEFQVAHETVLRTGRMLAPLGIINQHHEPTSFASVERPAVETYVLPSTWTQDGVGLSGRLSDSFAYQLQLTNGLDGAGFDDLGGIREGRQEERPGLNHLAVSGRLDWSPVDLGEHDLRLGIAAYQSNLDNGNGGASPGVDADLLALATDAQYGWRSLELRALFAWESIGGAADLSNVVGKTIASEIEGWYVEADWHCLPSAWKSGALATADAELFARYEAFDTQHEVPSGFTANPAGDRTQWVLGVAFFPRENVVIKADYEIRDDASSASASNRLNLGVGWSL